MPEFSDVSSLISQVRDGNARAAEELVRRFEHELQPEIRQYLRKGRIRRVVDSQDIYQSVFASFFIRLSLGEYDLDSSTLSSRQVKRMESVSLHRLIALERISHSGLPERTIRFPSVRQPD